MRKSGRPGDEPVLLRDAVAAVGRDLGMPAPDQFASLSDEWPAIVGEVLAPHSSVRSVRKATPSASAISTGKANTQNTLIATYDFARRNKWDFNLASIKGDYPTTTSLGFDRAYMQQLYQYGYEQGRAGPPWRKNLPAKWA